MPHVRHVVVGIEISAAVTVEQPGALATNRVQGAIVGKMLGVTQNYGASLLE